MSMQYGCYTWYHGCDGFYTLYKNNDGLYTWCQGSDWLYTWCQGDAVCILGVSAVLFFFICITSIYLIEDYPAHKALIRIMGVSSHNNVTCNSDMK